MRNNPYSFFMHFGNAILLLKFIGINKEKKLCVINIIL